MTETADTADHDPTILAARTLIGRLRASTYEAGVPPPETPPPWWKFDAEDDAALRLVLDFTLTENTRTVLRRNERYAQLLHCAMLRLCDHGETANSSTLVREIRDLLGGA
jgi:hypothetical protein